MRHRSSFVGIALFAIGAAGMMGTACSASEDDSSSSESASTQNRGASLYKPGNRFSGWGGSGDEYLDEIQPILGQRCVTCHGCTSAPCQLKLTSYEGLKRGANKHNVFATSVRSSETGPTRLKDGVSEADWKKKGFFSVTDGGRDSIMYKLLEHGMQNTAGFDLRSAFKLYDGKASELAFSCVDKKDVDERIAKAGTGMPFGFTGMPDDQYRKLTSWVERGAPGPSPEAQKTLAAPRDPSKVQKWEEFFNQDSPKAKLVARYLYEHLFFGRIHIDDSQKGRGDYFELVRSSTQSGPIKERVTEVPGDDPGGPFYYRLKKHTELITAKDAVVIHIDDALRERWQELFFTGKVNPQTTLPWDVASAPGYETRNPFVYFEQIPGRIRAEFMNETSKVLIDAMVKGDVCTGSSATFAIRDRFYALFLKPESDPSAIDPKFGQRDWSHLDPTSSSGRADAAFGRLMVDGLKRLKPGGLGVEDLWAGQGSLEKKDRNAWVTVFRHGKSATVHYGPVGQLPETMWVVDYGNFERLYYDLVALYRPWDNVAHKLGTWRTMSHIRAHGEDAFLLFMPQNKRDELRKTFTPGWLGALDNELDGTGWASALERSERPLDASRPIEDFISRARKYMGPTIAGFTTLDPDPIAAPPAAPRDVSDKDDLEAALFQMTLDKGQVVETFPDVTWVSIDYGKDTPPATYTILANRVYWSNSRLIGTAFELNRRPDLDTLQVVRGRIGAFPELFLKVPAADVGTLAAQLRDPEARRRIRDRYEIKRNSPEFWTFLDEQHTQSLADSPLEAAIIDTSEYLWPTKLQGTKEPVKNASFPSE